MDAAGPVRAVPCHRSLRKSFRGMRLQSLPLVHAQDVASSSGDAGRRNGVQLRQTPDAFSGKGVRNRFHAFLAALGDARCSPAPSDAQLAPTRMPRRKDIPDSPHAAVPPIPPPFAACSPPPASSVIAATAKRTAVPSPWQSRNASGKDCSSASPPHAAPGWPARRSAPRSGRP